jgi:hypothetical protein
MHEGDESTWSNQPKVQICTGGGHRQGAKMLKEFLQAHPDRLLWGNIHRVRQIGPGEHPVEDRLRRSCLHRSKRVERTSRRENHGQSTEGSSGSASRSAYS